MYKYLHIAIALLCLSILSACTEDKEEELDTNDLTLTEVNFDKDFKKFYVKARVSDSLSYISLTSNPEIRIEGEEYVCDSITLNRNVQPRLTKVVNVRGEELARTGYKLLLLADLNLPDEEFKKQRQLIEETRRWFAPNNLYIAFMSDGVVSTSYQVTDYVMSHYLSAPSSKSKIRLYRSILTKYQEIQSSFSNAGLLVISNGDVYGEDNMPVDPEHFQLQEQLLNTRSKGTMVYYANCSEDSIDSESNEVKGVIDRFCSSTGGKYYDKFDGKSLLEEMTNNVNPNAADYVFVFTNPDNKVYNGKRMAVHIDVYKNDKLLTHDTKQYVYGNELNPIIVNGAPTRVIILQGIIFVILFGIIAYLTLQFVIPYIDYRIFLRKYVIAFTKPSIIYRGIQVGDSCYYCKAPFIYGEKIVVKCKHVMHKDCWDENGYHCPEHGRHCPEGSHYYNSINLIDKRNSPFYTIWVFLAIPTALICWMWFLLKAPNSSSSLLLDLIYSIRDINPNTDDKRQMYENFANNLYCASILGYTFNATLAFIFSYLAHNTHPLKERLKLAFGKAVVAGIAGYIIYLMGSIVCIILNMGIDTMILDWIPSVVNIMALVYIISYKTRIVIRRNFIIAAVVISIASTIIGTQMTSTTYVDMRLALLIHQLINAICIALSLAIMAPRAEKMFLHVEGAIKSMDIALYKWLRTSAHSRVTIGRSVDCNLQLTWDMKSNIAPIQAEICYKNGRLCLHTIEEGVTVNNKPLKSDSYYRLVHGKKFAIGETFFTYEEKDI